MNVHFSRPMISSSPSYYAGAYSMRITKHTGQQYAPGFNELGTKRLINYEGHYSNLRLNNTVQISNGKWIFCDNFMIEICMRNM